MVQTALPKRQDLRTGRKKKKKKKRGFFRFVYRLFMLLLLLLVIGVCWMFFTNSGQSFRYLVADTLITTQHRQWAKYIIGEDELKKRVSEYTQEFEQMGSEKDMHTIHIPQPVKSEEKPLVQIEEISGAKYHGYIMTVNDPTKIRLGVPAKVGKGERVSSMVNRLGAIAGWLRRPELGGQRLQANRRRYLPRQAVL
jgi:exopolysaccharide biosynthesis protein